MIITIGPTTGPTVDLYITYRFRDVLEKLGLKVIAVSRDKWRVVDAETGAEVELYPHHKKYLSRLFPGISFSEGAVATSDIEAKPTQPEAEVDAWLAASCDW